MPRFFFHLASPGEYALDDIGADFPDVESAYLDCHQAALEIAFEMLRDHRDPTHYQFDIMDNLGRFLLDVPFSEVMRPRPAPAHYSAILSKVRESLRRNRILQQEIRDEFAQTRLMLESARALVKKSRARG
jgi:hypothetical protein